MNDQIKSVYLTNAEYVKPKLDSIGPGMCIAKWHQVSINLTAGLTQSCYHPRVHKVPLEELAVNPTALHNTQHKKRMRKMMLEGERPSECQYCWNIEDQPGDHLSDRHYRSGEQWAMETFDEIISKPWDWDVSPRYVEVNFNSACNFKCSYCSPHLSTTWREEVDRFGAYPTSTPHNSIEHLKQKGLMPIPNKDANPYVEAFWKWWPELYKGLKHFRMTGGEPLMDKNTYKVFDFIIKNPKPDLQLGLTSNFCPDPRLFAKFIEQVNTITDQCAIEHLMTFVSVDAYGKRAEYIRHGMNFDYMLENSRKYLENQNRRSISYIVTMNVMSITSLRQLMDQIIAMRKEFNTDRQLIWFDPPLLSTPAWQSIQILPERYRDILAADIAYLKTQVETTDTFLQGMKDYEINKLERDLEWMRAGDQLPPEKLKQDRADFYRFFTEHDARRGTNFLETFPEMEDFWDLCRTAAQ